MAGSVLCLAGLYAWVTALRTGKDHEHPTNYPINRLLVLGAALSIDNVAIGFALGSYRVNVLASALIIGSVSVALSLVGLEIGARLGERLGQRSELVGGAVLILVGLLIAGGSL